MKAVADVRVIVERYGIVLDRDRGPCPCCGTSARSTSFSVTQSGKGFHCHACGEHGDAIHLIQLLEHVSFPTAVGIVAGLFNVPLDVEIDDATRRREERRAANARAERAERWQRRERLRVRTIELTDLLRWVSREVDDEARALVDDPARDDGRLHRLVNDEHRVECELDRIEGELREIERHVTTSERLANVARILERAVALCRRSIGGGR